MTIKSLFAPDGNVREQDPCAPRPVNSDAAIFIRAAAAVAVACDLAANNTRFVPIRIEHVVNKHDRSDAGFGVLVRDTFENITCHYPESLLA